MKMVCLDEARWRKIRKCVWHDYRNWSGHLGLKQKWRTSRPDSWEHLNLDGVDRALKGKREVLYGAQKPENSLCTTARGSPGA